LPTAEVVIDGDMMNPQWNPLILPNRTSALLEHKHNSAANAKAARQTTRQKA
jgi:hypothetical protein